MINVAREKRKVTIVGGGPVGSLSAIFLSRRGFHVDLYEARSDIRNQKNAKGRSINLSLSLRGLSALKKAGLDERIKAIGIPMHARYIHGSNGNHYEIPYGKKGQFLLSTDRLELNRQLLSAAEKCDNVNLHFQQKLIRCDARIPTATFEESGHFKTHQTTLIVGCDGTNSTVRSSMLRGKMDFSQKHIEHGYKELVIPPNPEGDYALPPNFLHIWPRHEFMMIALPNLDKSFTCTLFMPMRNYDKIKTKSDVLAFFQYYFTDAIPVMGEEMLKESFFAIAPLPLITIRCRPYHYGGTAVIMGDAAHAVVPFYGQGLNSGLEDALLFDDIMEEYSSDLERVLPAFSDLRVDSGHGIADLSLYNYMEMRSHVATPWFLLRKKVDSMLHHLLPSAFIPLYSMVTFSRIPYDEVIRRSRKQDMIVDNAIITIGCSGLALFVYGCYKIYKKGLVGNLDTVRGCRQWLTRYFIR